MGANSSCDLNAECVLQQHRSTYACQLNTEYDLQQRSDLHPEYHLQHRSTKFCDINAECHLQHRSTPQCKIDAECDLQHHRSNKGCHLNTECDLQNRLFFWSISSNLISNNTDLLKCMIWMLNVIYNRYITDRMWSTTTYIF